MRRRTAGLMILALTAAVGRGAADDKSLSGWIEQLRDPKPAARRDAAEAIGAMGDDAEDAVAPLVAVLKDDRIVDVRTAAAEALGKIGPAAKDAVPALVAALKDRSPLVRGQAV